MRVLDNAPIAVKSLIAPLISAAIIITMIALSFVFHVEFQDATRSRPSRWCRLLGDRKRRLVLRRR